MPTARVLFHLYKQVYRYIGTKKIINMFKSILSGTIPY